MAEVAIGIDLGTSNSCVAIARGGKVEVLPNTYGESITASVVAFAQDGSITVGNAAKANIIHDPHHTIYSSKRLIGRYHFSEEVKKAKAICSYAIAEGPNHSVRIKVREEEFSLPEISAMILREMKSIAEARLGQAVTKAVITVPAYFNDNQRQATKDAGRIAGLEVLRILNEPTAAALSYGFGKGLNQRVAIYDLGGGTFDVSVLEIGTDVFEVLSTCGDTFLGGDDFDDRLIDLLADEFVAKEGVNLRNDPYALEKLKVAAEAAKKGLSIEEEVEIRIPDVIVGPDGRGRSVERRITAAEYSSLVMDLVMRTFKVCDEALQQANVVARDLAGVILVGGPTRLPLIRHAVKEYFQQEPRTDVNPDEVVALGAAIHAASLLTPQQQAFLLDVTPLSLKIGVAGGLAETVIDRNTPVPIEQTRTFTTFQDNQESVKIRVYQGESRQAAENELLGQFEFGGFRKARRGVVRIEVTFEINSDGIVNVTARDPATGQQSSTQITLSSGLTEDEIKQIIQRGRTSQVVPTGEAPRSAAPPARPIAPAAGIAGAAAAAAAATVARPTPPRVEPVKAAPTASAPIAPLAPLLGGGAEDFEVLPDDLPDLPELDAPLPAEEASDAQELIPLDEESPILGPPGESELEITGGFSVLQPATAVQKEALDIGDLTGSPDDQVPIETPAEDLFDRNYKDLSASSNDIAVELEVDEEPRKP